MAYFDLTTSEQILRVLAVGDADMTVETLDAQGLDDDLGAALDAALPTWEVIKDDVSKPANQRRLRLFAKYFCAGTVAVTAQVFILKKITDGSNEGQRSDKDGWAFLSASFLAKAQVYLDQINDDLGTSVPTTPFSVISRVIPDRDPIVQPRATNGS